MDTTLFVKRSLIWGISFVIGLIISFGIVLGPMGTDLATFSLKYFVLLVIAVSMIFVVWGDLLLGTKILKD